MIELWDAGRGTAPSRIPDVRRVFDEKISDIPVLLKGEQPASVPVPSPILPQVPQSDAPADSGDHAASEEVDAQPEDLPLDEDSGPAQIDGDEDTEDIDTIPMDTDDIKIDTEEHGMAHVEFTEDERKAVHVI